ncbi:uncharacterized protein LOC123204791 [Mangifera indica]|uniref:uncharacterized protein LOC123204791 n=1 Tax=Mangifera indica TaxID=29780 RepID=UPI001CF95AFC|nr:uncharacterized protein LOC123204791 [Mangifera indica]
MFEIQLAQQVSVSNSREMEKLPSQPQNPREHCNAIVTKNCKHLGESTNKVENKVDDEAYAKFLKNILSNKRRLEEFETVTLLEEYSAILQNKILLKLKDPRSFSNSHVVGKESFQKALCDHGASISLMSLSICRRLELEELKPTMVILQLVNQSIKYPMGIMENAPRKIRKFYIPLDFVVLEMKEDIQVPIIPRRLFLAIAGVIIDVKKVKFSFEISDEEVAFNVFQSSN